MNEMDMVAFRLNCIADTLGVILEALEGDCAEARKNEGAARLLTGRVGGPYMSALNLLLYDLTDLTKRMEDDR